MLLEHVRAAHVAERLAVPLLDGQLALVRYLLDLERRFESDLAKRRFEIVQDVFVAGRAGGAPPGMLAGEFGDVREERRGR